MRKLKTVISWVVIVGLSIGASTASAQSISIEGDLNQRAEISRSSDIVNISRDRDTVATVGVASIQLINPGRRDEIEIGRRSDVTEKVELNGDITNIAKESNSIAAVGVGSIQMISPLGSH
jgi:hypothetical protein